MTTLVTGATGFVGSAVVRRLLEAGHEVRVLARPGSDRRNLEGLPVETVEGDLRETGSLGRALHGCRYLFHVAADYRLWCRNPRELYESNVEGTRSLMLAALQAGVERVVHTSSVAVLRLRGDGSIANEESEATLEEMVGHYKRSKFLAEQVVRNLVREQGLPAVIVNPSTPIGPRDIKPTPTGRIIVDAARGRIPAYVDTGLNLAHVDDVATGHLLAFERGRIGRRYILGGENLSLREILELVARLCGRRPPRLRLPHAAVLPVAWISEAWAWLSNGPEPRATVDGLRMARKWMYFSSERAERELGYRSRPAEEAVRDALQWFRARGYC
ncbi:MAG: NAD-dependent epimerase/dehydratase family protein [Gammaproteobacteria bacterium]|nr:MAG: NAD-dependent epimerase/dehydratase family protein [Gammaproteobacteria bacterium]